MIRLDHRPLSDPNEVDPPVRTQACAVDDARGLVIQWTEEGTWYPAGEQGFQYTSPENTFTFIANVGGDAPEEGRIPDGRIFVLLNGLADRCDADAEAVTAASTRRMATDIEEAMILWPDLVPASLNRQVYFWFPDRHPTRYRDWGALGRMFGVGQQMTQAGDDVDAAWLRNRVWKGNVA
jgi:hypothetical protein